MRKRALEKTDSSVPQWLEVMRTITGLTETPGEADNPKIMAMAEVIARAYPEMRDYCNQYQHDSIAWCGLCAAFCCTVAGYRPPFGATDTDKFFWAQSFASDPGFIDIGAPVQGAVMVMTREGGGHVTLIEEDNNGTVTCRGGNQSDCVCLADYNKGDVIGYYWPKGAPMPEFERRTIEEGDSGPDVVECQSILGLPVDGEFGPTTEGGVKGFQAAADLDVDGVVGPQTWDALDLLEARVDGGEVRLSDAEIEAICELARNSPVAAYSWQDRGRAPAGYVQGMALAYADALRRDDDTVREMSQRDREDPDKDVLSWYYSDLQDLDWDTSRDGVDTLRALFAIMIGLGMRESSGQYCEGRDQSASNTSSTEAEAGLFQTSWNISSCCDAIPPLLREFEANPNGYLDQFKLGVTPSGTDLTNFGSGDGASYQFLSKFAPLFHVYVTAIGMRYLRQHWGPINRAEVELRDEAYELLQSVEALLDDEIEPPEPEPGPEPDLPTVDVEVGALGEVTLTVNDETVVPLPDAGKMPTVVINVISSGGARIMINGQPFDEDRMA